MLNSKLRNLMPIISSAEGIHLSVYLVNRGDLMDLKYQLREALQESYECLTPILTIEERDKILQPLDQLLEDDKILKEMKSNIAIFRNQDLFRVVNVPVPVDRICQIATSFHVKPLLRWLQSDQDFLLLGIEKDSAHLYLGSQSSLRLIDSLVFPNSFRKVEVPADESGAGYSSLQQDLDDTFDCINRWIFQITKRTKPKLFLAGERHLVKSVLERLRYRNTVKVPAADTFSRHKAHRPCTSIRNLLKEESRILFEKALIEFQIADEDNRTRKNIFQIAKAVVRGEVKKLIVTDEISIFGKVDRSSGGLALHPYDLDHEDDDILDDLAQIVLSQGGEVVVASLKQIPNGRPILAILDDDQQVLPKLEKFYEAEAI